MFKSLSLQNFKCFKNTLDKIEFRRINVVTGSNGRGKSSIFQSLLLLAQSYEAGKDWSVLKLNGKFVSLGNFLDVISSSADMPNFRITVETDNADDNCMTFSLVADGENSTECIVDNIYLNNNALISELSAGSLMGSSTVEAYKEVVKESKQRFSILTSTYSFFAQFGNVFYISADRRGPKNSEKRATVDYSNPLGIAGDKVINTLYEKKEDFQQYVACIMSVIMGGATVKAYATDDFEDVKLLLDSHDGGVGYKPVNVGFGYSYILPLIVLPLLVPDGSKIFIENPEAHLHPGAQSRLMRYLIKMASEHNLQLFVETHSEHIVNGLRKAIVDPSEKLSSDEAILHFLEQGEDQPTVKSITVDERGNLSDFPVDFFDQQRQDLFDIMKFAHNK